MDDRTTTHVWGHMEPFDENIQNYSSWLDQFEEFCDLNELPPESASTKRKSLFITTIGARHYNYIREKCLPDLPKDKTLTTLSKLLKEKYEPTGLDSTNKYLFHNIKQNEGESMSSMLKRIKMAASKCDFGSYTEQACVHQAIYGIKSNDVQRKLLALEKPSFEDIAKIIQREEAIDTQLKQLSLNSSVNKVQANRNLSQSYKRNQSYKPTQSFKPMQSYKSGQEFGKKKLPNTKECHRCGRWHDPQGCPARDWQCFICKKIGHTSRKCRYRNVRRVDEESNNQFQSVDEEQLESDIAEELVNSVSLMDNIKFDNSNCTCISCDLPSSPKCPNCQNIKLLQINKVNHKPELSRK
ncbi:hypothetical protein evm_013995 [Chilo suppressalis]|nr:hypothetical protein evm_013995 [Chilo suppressalis]